MAKKEISEKKEKIKTKKVKQDKANIEKVKIDKSLEKKFKKENSQDRKYKEYISKTIEEYNTNGKKTIVYFCDTFYPLVDGVIKVLDNYASLLCDKYNIVVIVPKHKNIVVKKQYLVIGVSSLYFKFVNYDLAFPEMDGYLSTVIKKLKIDLVHAHSPFNMGAYAAKVAKKKKVPFIITMHSQFKYDFMKHTKSEAMTNYLLKQILKVFNKADEVWTMHSKTAEVLKSYGFKKDNFYFVPNGTEYEAPTNLEEMRLAVNQKYNLDDSYFVTLFVGRLNILKNILFSTDCLKRVKDAGVKFKMFFVGDGPDEQILKSHIKKLGLENDIILTGKISDRKELANIFARSDLFLFPSVYDMSSLVQVEAATYSTPSLLIEGTATAQTVTNNVNGFTTPLDEEIYSNKIIELANNREYCKEIGKKAFEDLYRSWKQIAQRASDRYEVLIAQNENRQKKLQAIKNAKKSK